MSDLQAHTNNYLEYCQYQKRLDSKTLKAYRIPLNTVKILLSTIYRQYSDASTDYQRKNALRDAAVIELLFATGIRISELCSLKMNDINLSDRTILIYGKGSKERMLQIGNDDVIHILEKYKKNLQMKF